MSQFDTTVLDQMLQTYNQNYRQAYQVECNTDKFDKDHALPLIINPNTNVDYTYAINNYDRYFKMIQHQASSSLFDVMLNTHHDGYLQNDIYHQSDPALQSAISHFKFENLDLQILANMRFSTIQTGSVSVDDFALGSPAVNATLLSTVVPTNVADERYQRVLSALIKECRAAYTTPVNYSTKKYQIEPTLNEYQTVIVFDNQLEDLNRTNCHYHLTYNDNHNDGFKLFRSYLGTYPEPYLMNKIKHHESIEIIGDLDPDFMTLQLKTVPAGIPQFNDIGLYAFTPRYNNRQLIKMPHIQDALNKM